MLKLAWRNIWRNRRRTFINLGIIMFAVFASVYVRSLQTGIFDNLVHNFAGLHTGYIQLHAMENAEVETSLLDRAFEYNDSLLLTSAQFPGISGAAPRLEAPALASSELLSRGALVLGMDFDKESGVTNIQSRVTSGVLPAHGASEVLVGEGLAKLLKLQTGDTLVLLGQGYQSQSASGKYNVAGLVHFGSPDMNRSVVCLRLEDAQYLFRTDNRLTSIAINLDKPALLESTAALIRSRMDANKYSVSTWKDLMPEIREAIQADNAGDLVMVGILYSIITLGILGTFIMMAIERRYEFGVMTAVGMRKTKLVLMVLLEAVMLAVAGVLGGALVSIPVVLWFASHPIELTGRMAEGVKAFGVEPLIKFSTDPSILLAQGTIVLCICIGLSIFPIRFILTLDSVKAIREG